MENIQTVPQPENIKINLFPHQLASIFKMEKIEHDKKVTSGNYTKHTKIAINANYPGYGKTLSMLGLIARDKMTWDINQPYIFEDIISKNGGFIKKTIQHSYDKSNTNIILVSPSIITQWENEIRKTSLTYEKIIKHQHLENINPHETEIILIIPTIFNAFTLQYPDIAWKRFIFDEPGHIKVPAMKPIMAGFYWFVTATPFEIFSRHSKCPTSFIKNMISNLSPEEFFDGIIFKDPLEYLQLSFQMPPTQHIYHQCYQPISHMMRGIVNEQIITMVNAGNISGAISALGGKKTENIIEVVKQKKLQEIEEINTRIRLCEIRNQTQQKEYWTDQLNIIQQQLITIEQRINETLNNPCNICYENIENPVLEPKCHNIFCSKCLLTWLQTKETCPLCRNYVNTSELVYLIKNNSENNQHIPQKNLTKEQKLIEILNNNSESKFLLFSKFDSTFMQLYNLLSQNNITYSEIKGSTSSRNKIIDNFKNGTTKVLLVNATINVAGMNLQETTDIIIYHEMNDYTHAQIIGRANRIGRTIPLRVHHLKT
jgi:SNF2 family DNA or RNA helicase